MKCRRNDLARPFGRHLLPGNHQDVSGGIDLRTGAIALKLMVLVIDVDDFCLDCFPGDRVELVASLIARWLD